MSYLQINDPWKELRQEVCYGNVEPEVELLASTYVQSIDSPGLWLRLENIPALSAAISYDSELISNEACISLNRKLIQRSHLVPLEAVQYNFRVSSISKIAGAQISRHRIGQGHVSGSRRFRKQEVGFVYPMLSYIETKEEAENIYRVMSSSIKDSMDYYNQITQKVIGVKKSDARYLIPASTATERMWWINARALRDFFRLRLAPDAEWEVRRVAFMMLDVVMTITPSLFEDIAEKFIEK